MIYIELINEFWRKNDMYKFSPEEVSLYFFLFNHAVSKSKCLTFKLSSAYLECKLYPQLRDLHKARSILMKVGLIDYIKDTTRSLEEYKLIEP